MQMILSQELFRMAEQVVMANCRAGRRVAIAESCTGGLVSAALTEIAGSSDVFLAGYVTYSNEAKEAMLGVDPALIAAHGAVSHEVAAAMTSAALERSGADVAVSITGIAGPGGGSPQKPVGTVFFGLATSGTASQTFHQSFGADKIRAEIRLAAAIYALELLLP